MKDSKGGREGRSEKGKEGRREEGKNTLTGGFMLPASTEDIYHVDMATNLDSILNIQGLDMAIPLHSILVL